MLLSVTAWVTGRKLRQSFYREPSGREREEVVYLRVRRSLRRVGDSNCERNLVRGILGEVRIFNKMKLIAPCVRGVPKMYIEWLGRLYTNPNVRPKNASAEVKVIYLYALLNLLGREDCPKRRRQLLKNALYIYRTYSVLKSSSRKSKLITKTLYPSHRGLFKIFKGENLTKIVSRLESLDFKITSERGVALVLDSSHHPSSIVYNGMCQGSPVRVKNYVDRVLPAECYHVQASSPLTFTIRTGVEKTTLGISQTSDTMFITNRRTRIVTAIFVVGKVVFGTNMARRAKNLDVALSLERGAKIFRITAPSKAEAQGIIAHIKERRNNLDFLLNPSEARETLQAEKFLQTAHMSRFVSGVNLLGSFGATRDFVPTLGAPSHVIQIDNDEDFFHVLDSLPLYRFLGSCGQKLSVIFLHSSQNPQTLAIIQAFTNTEEVKSLIARGILFFFIDRMSVPQVAINFLCRMDIAQHALPYSLNMPLTNNPTTLASVQESHGLTSVFLTNTLNKSAKVESLIPLSLATGLAIYKKQGRTLTVTNIEGKGEKESQFRLPHGARVLTQAGQDLELCEAIANKILVRFDCTLKPYEERTIDISPIFRLTQEEKRVRIAC